MFEKELNSMGKGWFIARYANELGIGNYDVTSKFDREAIYKATSSNHAEIIRSIIEDRVKHGSKKTVRLETEHLESDKLYEIAWEVFCKTRSI